MGYIAGRLTLDILAKDATHDTRFLFYDHSLPRIAQHISVTVGQSAGVKATFDPPCLASADFVSNVLTVELADKTTKPDQDRIDHTLVNRTDFDAKK